MSIILFHCAAWASSPEVRAGCGKSARPDPWRGLRAITIPTPTLLKFPHLARVTLERSQRGARLPRPKLCIYGGSGEIFSLYFADKISSGNRNPQGDAIEAEERVAAGRRFCPEAVTEQSGMRNADASGPKSPIRFRHRRRAKTVS